MSLYKFANIRKSFAKFVEIGPGVFWLCSEAFTIPVMQKKSSLCLFYQPEHHRPKKYGIKIQLMHWTKTPVMSHLVYSVSEDEERKRHRSTQTFRNPHSRHFHTSKQSNSLSVFVVWWVVLGKLCLPSEEWRHTRKNFSDCGTFFLIFWCFKSCGICEKVCRPRFHIGAKSKGMFLFLNGRFPSGIFFLFCSQVKNRMQEKRLISKNLKELLFANGEKYSSSYMQS